jgi:ppGpp synthetase/RelA/SpoT-type nucleotidyltranferase
MEETIGLFSKNQLVKFGDRLREESISRNISKESLLQLHDLRLSYKAVLSTVFNVLSEESKKIRKSRVVTYRIKRIESIISKLNRFPNMELGKMVDIAGCRCIVDSIQDIYQIAELLEKRLDIIKIKDYISNSPSDDDGYAALHLYVKCKEDNKKPVEIQIRTKDQHNWATFVEIIDVVYGTKIKEGQRSPELQRFCYLLSNVNGLTSNSLLEIITIEKDYNIYSMLSSVFNQNNIQTRKNWLNIEGKTGHNFFIIEVDKNKRTHIESFSDFEVAEAVYLKRFNNEKTNIVLTHLEAPSYKQISIAYSNYILSMHKFQEDLCEIAKKAIKVLLKRHKKVEAQEMKELYDEYIKKEIIAFNEEIDEFKREVSGGDSFNLKMEEWVSDISDRMNRRAEIFTSSDIKINLSLTDTIALYFTNVVRRLKFGKN